MLTWSFVYAFLLFVNEVLIRKYVVIGRDAYLVYKNAVSSSKTIKLLSPVGRYYALVQYNPAFARLLITQ